MSEVQEMGWVVAAAEIINLHDLLNVKLGKSGPDDVRCVHVEEALIDTGATTLCLPTRVIQQLGLVSFGERESMSSGGRRKAQMFGPVKLMVQGRTCNVDVVEVPDEVPVLIGQVPLELLDFVVDPPSRRLIGNPAHGGEQMLEMY